MNDLSADSLKLDSQLCFKLYAASRAVVRGYKPMLDRLGLTYPQYLVMLVLWEWQAVPVPQPTVKALGERLSLDSGTLTPLLKRLEQLQLVQRQRSGRDEREVHLSLSETGLALRDQVPPLKAALLCESGVDLNSLDQLRDGLDHLLQQIRALS
ncbi:MULTISPECIES: MarR family winged helix-turn-helix transcriptional regulator [Pseudomonas]|uniref:MarR family transcriptional regulator n=3 Tax=Pseudomonas TaxID=286 RepID=A0A9Q6IBI8_9PSED|nr:MULTISPECIES: MarR family transcriptional regulator [Pseudomonas]MBS7560766.1 MarR family transcriptional regulator [Pseudomonas sp. RC4D1]MBW8356971.1 MarR family transcriptional regulator [Pseudomonas sp.]MCO7579353.1 MarR family transcriptional regulator [Pseudomonas protegens]MCO7584948.1 MarR family transcriptional regulator [Pseudomonas chlororaphis]MCO7602458.1 MarR family transcriptional regulator [Pseudomonas chlororaphis]